MAAPDADGPDASGLEGLLETQHRVLRLAERLRDPELLAAAQRLALHLDGVLKDNDRLTHRTIELTLALDSSGIGTWIWTITGPEPELVSERGIARLFGLDEDAQALHLPSLLQHVAAEDRERLRRALREGLREELEFQVVDPDGRTRFLSARGQPLSGDSGTAVLSAGTVEDVSDRKRMEESLRDAEARYRALVEQIPAISYIVKLDRFGNGRTSYISRQVESILGYSVAEWLADPDLWWRIVHSHYRDTVKAEIDRKDKDPTSSQRIQQEYPVYARDGRLVWLRNESTTEWGKDGRLRYTDGVLLDVTEQREHGERLRGLEKALDTMRMGVTITDLDGRISYANPAEARMHGYASAADLLGQPASMLGASGRTRPDLGAGVSHESVNRRRDGSTFRVRLWTSLLTGAASEPVAIVTVCEDLS